MREDVRRRNSRTRVRASSRTVTPSSQLPSQWFHAVSQEIVGIDVSTTAVRRARERFSGRANSDFRQADLLKLDPSFNSSFDLVVVADVIYYLPPASLTDTGLEDLASSLARLLRPGGVLLVANHYAPVVDPSSRISRRIHQSFCTSQYFELALERWRPFWLAGLFEPTGRADLLRTDVRRGAHDDHDPVGREYPERTESPSSLRGCGTVAAGERRDQLDDHDRSSDEHLSH